MNNRRSFVSFLCVSLILSALLSFNYAFIYSTFRGNVGLTQKLGSSVREEIFEEFRVSITDISHWYERRNLPRVRYVVENTLYPLLLQYSNDELQQNEAQVALNMMFELLQRWAFNYCIQITLSLFPNSKTTTSTHFLRNLDTYLVNLARQGLVTADTVNILLSDAVCRSNIRRADYIFELFFISSTSRTGRDSDYVELGLVFPTVRSINIMMEAHRRYVESSTNAQVLRAKKPWINRSSKISSDREDYFETVIGGFEIPRDYSMVWFYYSLFESYDENLSSRLRPDCYTLSTLVRISSQPGEIVSLLTQNPSVVTSPVLRCAIESLGNLGDPSAALLLYLRHCQHQKLSNGSYFSTFPVGRKTGDAIITALLSCPNQRLNSTTAYKEFCGKLSAEVAMELLFDGQCNESKYGIRCSSKGYTLLYTHIQRSLRRLSEPFSYSSEGNGHADDIDRAVLQRLRLEVAANFRKSRDRLFECMKKEIVAEISSTVGNRTAGPVSDDENPAVELNSRLIDALVRSYQCEDIDEVKRFWKRSLLPLVLLYDQNQSQFGYSPDGLLETGLETWMFLCGRNRRPDVGLEIARAVRKRLNRPRAVSGSSPNDTAGRRSQDSRPLQLYQERLYKSYLLGSRDAPDVDEAGDDASVSLPNPFKPLLFRNWEESIRLELGIQSNHSDGSLRIRIRFK